MTNPLRTQKDRRLQKIAGPCGIVLFGITGDLSRKKIIPALYDLANRGLLPPSFSIVGVAMLMEGQTSIEQIVEESIREHNHSGFDETTFRQLMAGLRYIDGNFADEATFAKLRETFDELDATRGTGGNFAFYLAVPPKLFPVVLNHIKTHGLAAGEGTGWRRVVIEKPFGHDLQSAKDLHEVVSAVFDPEEIFRIDHYLGKETVQNILALRFANQFFEPIWNSSNVDHVQITMAEDIGIGGRAGYYDGIGAARDVIQNHLLQLMALTAMEEPVDFSPAHLRAEKEKVLGATHFYGPVEESAVQAQYGSGWQGGEYVCSYREEKGINPESRTNTYAALRLGINTRRWAGVPFYLRTGKRLGRRVTEIAVVFKRPPFLPFDDSAAAGLEKNTLVIRIQPDEGVTFRFGSKVPGDGMVLRDVTMDFDYGHSFTEYTPEAYERLILDVLLGEPPLFPQQREVELSWQILDQATAVWDAQPGPLESYAPGSWGPACADLLVAQDGRQWRRP